MARGPKKFERWSEERAREELERYERSGKSLSAYSRESGIGAHRLRWWRERLGRQGRKEGALTLVPAVVTMPSAEATVRVALSSGSTEIVVELGSAGSASWVAQLIRELEEPRC